VREKRGTPTLNTQPVQDHPRVCGKNFCSS